MFGGEFGAFRSKGWHFFNKSKPVYRELVKILALRRQKIALRRGRQYLWAISGDGQHSGEPQVMGERMRSVVTWSRLFDEQQLLLAINTDIDPPPSAWVSLEAGHFEPGMKLTCL